jgi:hypothetical protein
MPDSRIDLLKDGWRLKPDHDADGVAGLHRRFIWAPAETKFLVPTSLANAQIRP